MLYSFILLTFYICFIFFELYVLACYGIVLLLTMLYHAGFPVFLAIKFQIISRFCPSQNGQFFFTKWLLPKAFYNCRSIKLVGKCPHTIFSHFLGQIPGYFLTWTDKIQISRFFRFYCESCAYHWTSVVMLQILIIKYLDTNILLAQTVFV